MYAIVKTGGKQYKVAVGDVVEVEKVTGEPGASVALPALLVVDGTDVTSDAAALARMLAADDAGRVRVLDVREDAERLLEALDPSDHVPLGEVLAAPTPHVPGPGETLVVYCAAGVRSARAREAIVAVAPEAAERVLSLAGGLDAWTRG